jgi:S-phase kinase-associated protein 1
MGDVYTGPVKVTDEDGNERLLVYNVWNQSKTIMSMAEDIESDKDVIPLASVPKEALDKVVEYMEKMAAFKADGITDEGKQQWISEYKKTMGAQDQLPLLFQTLTAANFMNVKTLLDELCKFVAEMIAQRTPNEILDYFNIKKDESVQEEMKLIATHTWIDPEGLIKKDLYVQATQINGGVRPETDDEMMRIINQSRGLDPEKCAAEERAAAAEARMGRGGQPGAGATRDDL